MPCQDWSPAKPGLAAHLCLSRHGSDHQPRAGAMHWDSNQQHKPRAVTTNALVRDGDPFTQWCQWCPCGGLQHVTPRSPAWCTNTLQLCHMLVDFGARNHEMQREPDLMRKRTAKLWIPTNTNTNHPYGFPSFTNAVEKILNWPNTKWSWIVITVYWNCQGPASEHVDPLSWTSMTRQAFDSKKFKVLYSAKPLPCAFTTG